MQLSERGISGNLPTGLSDESILPHPMPFTEFETASIEAAMSDFMAKRRPPREIRDKPDLAFFDEFLAIVDGDEQCCFWG